jgi:hypothetical protein
MHVHEIVPRHFISKAMWNRFWLHPTYLRLRREASFVYRDLRIVAVTLGKRDDVYLLA